MPRSIRRQGRGFKILSLRRLTRWLLRAVLAGLALSVLAATVGMSTRTKPGRTAAGLLLLDAVVILILNAVP